MEEKLFDGAFYTKLSRLRMSNRIKLTMGLSGGRKSTQKGNSVEFSDFREYMLGDDIRKIDWNAYGRMDRFFVKLFQEEKEGNYRIFIDGSKSMDYGSDNKSILARRIAGMFAYVALYNLDRVYVTQLRESNIVPGKGKTGRQAFSKILMELENMTFDGNTDLNESIRECPISGRGVSIVISDFFQDEDIESMLRYLAYQKQEIILVHVLATEEVTPDLEGHLNLIDMETQRDFKVSMSNQVLKTYDKTLKSFRENMEKLARKYQAHYLYVNTKEGLDRIIELAKKSQIMDYKS